MKYSSHLFLYRIAIANLLIGLTLLPQLNAQTWNERVNLKDSLNAAKAILGGSNPVVIIDLSDPDYGLESLTDYLGGCRDVRSGEELWLIDVPGEDYFQVTHVAKEQGTIQIPVESHLLVCHLNEWLNLTWVGLGTTDTGKAKYNFDDICTDIGSCPTCQKYYMRTPSYTYGWLVPGPWFPPANYTVRMTSGGGDVAKVIDPDVAPGSADLFYMDNKEVLMAYRKQPSTGHETEPDTNYHKRTHFKLIFDYDKVPDPLWDYVFPTGTYPESSWTLNRLNSIEVTFQFREYSTNNCPPGTIDPDYDPDVAKVTVSIEYNSGGAGNTWTCELTSDDVGKNSSVDEANEWLWNARWWNGPLLKNWMEFDVDENGFLFLKTKAYGDCPAEETFWSIRVATPVSPVEYCSSMFPVDGTFCLDDMTGELIYNPDPPGGSATCPCSTCATMPVTCIDFCEKIAGYQTIENVIAASARVFSEDWEFDPVLSGTWNTTGNPNTFFGDVDNRYQRGEDGRLRPQEEFAYRSKIKSATGGNKIYEDAGVFVDDAGNTPDAFHLFNWVSESANDQTKWLSSTTITQYSPSGQSIEEQNSLDIYSTAKLGYGEFVPEIVSLNAQYPSIAFESFEERKDATGSFAEEITDEYAHSGKLSYRLNSGGPSDPLLSFQVTDQIVNEGVLVKLWLKRTYGSDPTTGEAPFKLKFGTGTPYLTLANEDLGTLQGGLIHRVAQTGEWTLYHFIKDDFVSGDLGTTVQVTVNQNVPGTESVWVDDIRVQPFNSEVTCFVYDPNTLRLLTQFDDQHFGMYYQYSGEGKLVRTLRETERGMVTVAETQYHSVSEQRYPFTPSSTIQNPDFPSSISLSTYPASGTAASGASSEFDMLNFKIGPDGTNMKFFGGEVPSLADFKPFMDLEAPEVGNDILKDIAPDLPELEKVELLKELIAIEKERTELRDQIANTADETARTEMQSGVEKLNERRTEILRDKLGMTEKEAVALYKDLQQEQSETEPEGNSSNEKEAE